MLDSPQIIQSGAQLTAVIHLVVPRSQIGAVMGPGVEELMAALAAQGIVAVGPRFSHHLQMDPDNFDFELGVPVTVTVAAVGRVRPGHLPATTVAQTIYHGAYEGLGSAWGEFDAWIEAEGLTPAPDLWENYVMGPESTPDPAAWRTELIRPVKVNESRKTSIEREGAQVIKVGAGADRFGEQRGLGISTISFKLCPQDSSGLLVIENVFRAPGGPARHLHYDQDEWFYAVEGDFIIEVGDERFNLKPGDSLLAPRQVTHAWAYVGDTVGRMLITFMPAGKMEAFFREVTKANAMPPQDPQLWRAHGMELVGPPLLPAR